MVLAAASGQSLALSTEAHVRLIQGIAKEGAEISSDGQAWEVMWVRAREGSCESLKECECECSTIMKMKVSTGSGF